MEMSKGEAAVRSEEILEALGGIVEDQLLGEVHLVKDLRNVVGVGDVGHKVGVAVGGYGDIVLFAQAEHGAGVFKAIEDTGRAEGVIVNL